MVTICSAANRFYFMAKPSLSRFRFCRKLTSEMDQKNRGRPYSGPQLSDDEMRALAADGQIRFHINVLDKMPATQLDLLPTKKVVDVRDRFVAQQRNADYSGREFFTDSHLAFQGRAAGYGDFSVIGSNLRPSGGPAHAVAIHAVFREPKTEQLWVEHFVSDDVDPDIGNVESKFHQAALKLVRASTQRKSEFGRNRALFAYAADVENNHFPGLADNKRREIHHHIALSHHLL
jgi:hypothetical protein